MRIKDRPIKGGQNLDSIMTIYLVIPSLILIKLLLNQTKKTKKISNLAVAY